jgi:hypothetical protein
MAQVTSIANQAVFDLPWLVARQEGLFAQEGIEVVFLPRTPWDAERPLETDPGQVPPFWRYTPFEAQEADLPPEWRSLLTPEDDHLPWLRYKAPRLYPPDEFEHTYRWMRSWDLIPEGASYAQLVEHRVGAAG